MTLEYKKNFEILFALVIKSSANIHKLYTSDIHKKCEQEKGYQKTFNTISQ